jgi:hypothetical protein
VSDEHALQSRHANPTTVLHPITHYLLYLPSEELDLIIRSTVVFRLPIAVKVREEGSGLLRNCVVDRRRQVDTTRPDKCGIESVNVVRSEEYNPLFARGDTVQSVQESREGHGGLISDSNPSVYVPEVPGRTYLPVFACLNALVKRGIDVFDENETPFGSVRHQVVELVVGQATLGEVQQAYIIRQRTSECLNERGLSRSRWSMEQIASAVRDTLKTHATHFNLSLFFFLFKERERKRTHLGPHTIPASREMPAHHR